MLDKNKVYYMACLYSLDVDKLETQEEKDALLEKRFDNANKMMAYLSKEGNVIISPISMNHTAARDYDLPKDGEFGKRIDVSLIDRCDAIIVCDEEGIERSVGVQAEIKHARETNKDVYYITKFKSIFKESKEDYETRYLCWPELDKEDKEDYETKYLCQFQGTENQIPCVEGTELEKELTEEIREDLFRKLKEVSKQIQQATSGCTHWYIPISYDMYLDLADEANKDLSTEADVDVETLNLLKSWQSETQSQENIKYPKFPRF